jgi:hypothetical protein
MRPRPRATTRTSRRRHRLLSAGSTARPTNSSRRQRVRRARQGGQGRGGQGALPHARSYWERIEPVAESFGDLDPMIDGREDVTAEGMEFTGYHRLEKDLWVDRPAEGLQRHGRQAAGRRHRVGDQGQGRRAQPAPARQRLQGAPRRDRHRQGHRRGRALQPHRPVGLRGQRRGLHGGHRGAASVPRDRWTRRSSRPSTSGARPSATCSRPTARATGSCSTPTSPRRTSRS